MEGKISLVKRSNGYYYVRRRGPGFDKWVSTGQTTQREAMNAARGMGDEKPKPMYRTLRSCADAVLEYVEANMAAKTHEAYRLAFDAFIRIMGEMDISDVGRAHVDRFKVHRLSEVSITTTNIQIRTLRAAFALLARWDLIDENPFEGVKQVRVPHTPPVFLTKEQFARLRVEIDGQWYEDIVVFAVCTGMRAGEILALEWKHVNMKHRTAHVTSTETHTTKTGKGRVVPLNAMAIETIRKRPQSTIYVFDDHGHPFRRDSVSAAFKRAVRAAGLPNAIHFHSLRHTFASWLVQDGVSLYTVARLLGHSHTRTTEMYAHLQPETMHNVVDRITW